MSISSTRFVGRVEELERVDRCVRRALGAGSGTGPCWSAVRRASERRGSPGSRWPRPRGQAPPCSGAVWMRRRGAAPQPVRRGAAGRAALDGRAARRWVGDRRARSWPGCCPNSPESGPAGGRVVEPGAAVRARARAAGPGRAGAGGAGARGPALVGPLDARPAGVPGAEPAAERIVLVATYRSDELHRGHPLRPLLAELDRAAAASSASTCCRSRARSWRSSSRGSSGRAATALRRPVFERSEGNAFFAEELVAAGAATAGLPPDAARHPARADRRAPEPARRGAPRGRRRRPARARAAARRRCGPRRGARDEALREAVDRAAAGRRRGGRLRVPPRAAARGGLRGAAAGRAQPAARRVRGRRSRRTPVAGRACARRPPSWPGTGTPRTTWSRPCRAPSRAAARERRHGFAEASAHYERALEVWDRLDAGAAAGATASLLLRRAAEAANLARRAPARGGAHPRRAGKGDEARRGGARGRAVGAPGPVPVGGGRQRDALAAYEEAVGLVPAEPPSAARARVLAARGQGLMLLARYEESRLVREAIAIARRSRRAGRGGPRAQHARRRPRLPRRPRRAVAHCARRAGSPRRSATSTISARAYLNLADDPRGPLDRLDEAIEVAREGVASCRELGLARDYGVSLQHDRRRACSSWGAGTRPGGSSPTAEPQPDRVRGDRPPRSRAAAGRGRVRAATRHLDRARRLMIKTRRPQYTAASSHGPARRRCGRGARSRRAPRSPRALERLDGTRWYESAARGLLVVRGLRAKADLAEQARARAGRRPGRGPAGTWPLWTARLERVLAELGQLPTAPRPQPETAAQLADRSRPSSPAPRPAATRPRGRRAAGGLGRRSGPPYPAAYARWREAEALLARRGRRAGAARRCSARRTPPPAARRGAAAAGDRAARPAGPASTSTSPARPRCRRRSRPPPSGSGSPAASARCWRWWRSGLTNREIAEALFVSEKTAGAHVPASSPSSAWRAGSRRRRPGAAGSSTTPGHSAGGVAARRLTMMSTVVPRGTRTAGPPCTE